MFADGVAGCFARRRDAALPPHSAVRLCLTAAQGFFLEAMPLLLEA